MRLEELADGDSARGRLLIAASRLFTQRGYKETTVRDIAAEVGIQSGSIFHHFRSKEEILREAMAAIIHLALDRMAAALEQTESLEDELRALIRCELESIHDRSGAGFQLLGMAWRHLEPANQRQILVLRDRYSAIWLERLERANAAGLSPVPSELLLQFLRGTIGNTHTWFDPKGRVSLGELGDEIYRAFFGD